MKDALQIEWGTDFGSPHETELTKQFDKPVFVYGFPTACKAFYMELWPGRPEVSKSVDLLAPEGYGEVTGVSERISDPTLLLERIHRDNLPEDAFRWYIDLRRYGSVRIADSDWVLGGPCPGSPASIIFVRRSLSLGPWGACIHKAWFHTGEYESLGYG